MHIDKQLINEFEQFTKKEFIGKIVNYNIRIKKQWFYVQAGEKLGYGLHYEYNNEHVELHIELEDSGELQQFLFQEIRNNELEWKYWSNRPNHCCQLKKLITTKDELFEAFIQIRNLIEPVIKRFETIPKVTILEIGSLLSKGLTIPPYQRPYRWKAEKHVRQLLEDIQNEIQRKATSLEPVEYRIGSVILHNDGDKLNIVDGQQRLVTILLILKALGVDNDLLERLHFTHKDSMNNIVFNYEYINKYISSMKVDEKNNYREFLLGNCTINEIEIFSLKDAFQLFDSQNVRGKELEPADLLKAYHLREMNDYPEDVQKQCVLAWEKAIDEGFLNKVIGDYLFRIRKWKKHEWDYFFTKEDIDEFKGINLIQTIKDGQNYPYALSALHNSMSNNYQIDEPIVNGKRFFNYVDFYVKLYKDTTKIISQDSKLAFYYKGSNRVGDMRIRNLYRNVIMCYLDKFGKDNNFEEFTKELYRWAYTKRLTHSQIRFQTILKMLSEANDINPIKLVDSWYKPNIKYLRRHIKPLSEIKIEKENKEIMDCIE